MAITHVAETGKATGTGTSVAVTVTTAPAAGHLLVARIGLDLASTAISSVTDTKGNTWTIDEQHNGTNQAGVGLVSTGQDGGTLTTADTITVTLAASVNSVGVIIDEFAGADTTATRVDGTPTTAVGSGTARTAGTISYTAGDLICVAYAFKVKETSFTEGSGFSAYPTQYLIALGTTNVSTEGEYLVTTTGTSTTTTGTGGVSAAAHGVAVAYKPSTASAGLTYDQDKLRVAGQAVKRAAFYMAALPPRFRWRGGLLVPEYL